MVCPNCRKRIIVVQSDTKRTYHADESPTNDKEETC
jgi:hypothetical protein